MRHTFLPDRAIDDERARISACGVCVCGWGAIGTYMLTVQYARTRSDHVWLAWIPAVARPAAAKADV